jgi:hypothetical protein
VTGRPFVLDAGSTAVAGAGRRMRLHALAVLALTLVAGLALGWGLAHRVGAAGSRAPGSRAAVADPGASHGRLGGRGGPGGPPRPNMQAQLGLSDGQCKAIDSVFASRRGQIDAFWRGPGRQLRAILDSTGADVRAVLDSGQRVKLDSINAQRHRGGNDRGGPDRRGGFCAGRGGGGGPPSGAPR